MKLSRFLYSTYQARPQGYHFQAFLKGQDFPRGIFFVKDLFTSWQSCRSMTFW
jgi:hypothetical protein